jgi:hypothetical protein
MPGFLIEIPHSENMTEYDYDQNKDTFRFLNHIIYFSFPLEFN